MFLKNEYRIRKAFIDHFSARCLNIYKPWNMGKRKKNPSGKQCIEDSLKIAFLKKNRNSINHSKLFLNDN